MEGRREGGIQVGGREGGSEGAGEEGKEEGSLLIEYTHTHINTYDRSSWRAGGRTSCGALSGTMR